MNYLRAYSEIILRSQIRGKPEGYSERHHIIPKSLGGSDNESNLTWLTGREHFIAHCLLARVYGGLQWASVICMKGSNNIYMNARLYERARKEYANIRKGVKRPEHSERMKGENHPLYGKKRPKYSKNQTGSNNHMFGRIKEKHFYYGKKRPDQSVKMKEYWTKRKLEESRKGSNV